MWIQCNFNYGSEIFSFNLPFFGGKVGIKANFLPKHPIYFYYWYASPVKKQNVIYIVKKHYVTSFGVPKTNKLHNNDHLKKLICLNLAIFQRYLWKLLFLDVKIFVFLWSNDPHRPSTRAYVQVENRLLVNFRPKTWYILPTIFLHRNWNYIATR